MSRPTRFENGGPTKLHIRRPGSRTRTEDELAFHQALLFAVAAKRRPDPHDPTSDRLSCGKKRCDQDLGLVGRDPHDHAASIIRIDRGRHFYGYANTGYHIGYTRAEGNRRGRSIDPAVRDAMTEALHDLIPGPYGDFTIDGETPQLPCSIWCPSCNALNDVDFPNAD